MALELRRQSAQSVPTPDTAHESFFVDEDGQPVLKNSSGVTRPAVSLTGDPLVLNEQGSAPGTEALKGKLYSKDVSGGTEFFYLDAAGNEVQITEGGALLGGGGGGTWFEDAVQGPNISVAIPTGGGTTTVSMGVTFPILGANQATTMRIQIEGGRATADVGFLDLLLGWGTQPSLPDAAFLGNLLILSGGLELDVFPVSGIELDASAVVSLVFDQDGSDPYEATYRVSISPGTLLTFDPTIWAP